MTTLTQVADSIYSTLGPTAERMARDTGFVQRRSKLSGAQWVQTLTFGWQANPDASLGQLAQTAATLGVSITEQGLEARFSPAAARCLEQVLQIALTQVMAADPMTLPLFQRFTAVYLLDSTQVQLPGELAARWPGNGAYHVPAERSAALKVQLGLEFRTGRLQGPFLQPGRAGDRSSPTQHTPVIPGALRIADLGYFDLDTLQAWSEGHGFWLTRRMAGTLLYDAHGDPLNLKRFLRQQKGSTVECPVQLGQTHRLTARLLAVRVSPEVVARRRRQLKEAARRRQAPVSPERWALAGWTIYVTNVPPELLSLREAWVLMRARWQMELLYKLWKQHGHLDTSRSHKPWRILCEVYAKLLGLLIQHWLLLLGAWNHPDRSWVKAAQTIRQHAWHLAARFPQGTAALLEALAVLQRCLSIGCRVNKRRKHPSAFQLWQDPSLQTLT